MHDHLGLYSAFAGALDTSHPCAPLRPIYSGQDSPRSVNSTKLGPIACLFILHAARHGMTLSQPAAQAADIVRLVGIGRNEYIATMNKCKAKKLLWRVNRAIVKDLLPTEQLDTEKQDWWTAHVVNIGGRALMVFLHICRSCSCYLSTTQRIVSGGLHQQISSQQH